MASTRTYKGKHEADAEKLARIREILAEAEALSAGLSTLCSHGAVAVLQHGIETASEKAVKLHKQAHFGATGELLGDTQ